MLSATNFGSYFQLLVEHADEIAPDASDPLHDVLEELGDVPDINTLMGKGGLVDLAFLLLLF